MWDQKIPSYIYGKQNIVRLILWTALFALVFINIYKPFSSTSWYKVSEFKFFVFSSLIILTGVLVVVLSRIILFHWGKRHAITVRTYAIWIVLEIFFMSLFYTIYTLVLNPEREYMEVFNDSAVNTSLVLLLPYSVLHLYFSYSRKCPRVLHRCDGDALQRGPGKKRLMARHNHIRKAHQHRHDLIAQHIVGEVFKHLPVLVLIDIQPHTGKFAAAQRVDERPRVDQPAPAGVDQHRAVTHHLDRLCVGHHELFVFE